MTMRVHTRYGEKILFNHPHRGTTTDKKNARMHLTVGVEYTVMLVKEGFFKTRVFLNEIPVVSFPIRMFENASTRNGWGDDGKMLPNTYPYGVRIEDL